MTELGKKNRESGLFYTFRLFQLKNIFKTHFYDSIVIRITSGIMELISDRDRES